jgi:serine-type D-Ala-D-Ala carboxypeptidase/endopeptidase
MMPIRCQFKSTVPYPNPSHSKRIQMNALYRICLAMLLLGCKVSQAAESNEDELINAFLHENFDHKNVGMVIGIVDEHGTHVFSAGKLDNGTDQAVDGDTVFEIGSISKTFTVLLLQDMVQRGEMKLDDPVAKYLPISVKMPTHDGKEITLLNLAAQDSGLPRDPDNLSPTRGLPENPFADYTVERLYEFLSNHKLQREPGKEFEYSNVGMALLGHVIVLKAGKDYESLVVERICRPLNMDSTGVVFTPELKSRLAMGHGSDGKRAPNWDFQVYAGAGAVRSTANDLLKYVAANIGLTQSDLTPLMQKTHVLHHLAQSRYGNTALPWMDRSQSDQTGTELLGHAGGTGGYETFIGFDKQHRRGVVVLEPIREPSRFSK